MSLQIGGEQVLEAARADVWRLLNDPDVLQRCIPGCESLQRSGECEFAAVVTAKVGAIRAKFSGRVQLVDIDYLNGYRLVGEGSGGVAGFAKMQITVALRDAVGGTALEYAADAQIGGKLAQLGQRLILSTAGKLAAEFFSNFAAVVKEAV